MMAHQAQQLNSDLIFKIYPRFSNRQKPYQFIKRKIQETEKKLGISILYPESYFLNLDYVYTLENQHDVCAILCQKNYSAQEIQTDAYFASFPSKSDITSERVTQLGMLFTDYSTGPQTKSLAQLIINNSFWNLKNQKQELMITLVRTDKRIDQICCQYGAARVGNIIHCNNTPCVWLVLKTKDINVSTPSEEITFLPNVA